MCLLACIIAGSEYSLVTLSLACPKQPPQHSGADVAAGRLAERSAPWLKGCVGPASTSPALPLGDCWRSVCGNRLIPRGTIVSRVVTSLCRVAVRVLQNGLTAVTFPEEEEGE